MNNTKPWEEGDPESKICILGEAPARTEVRLGRPLVGPSGQLLEQCMHAAGIVRRECYLTNVFETEVKKSKTGDMVTTTEGDILWTKKGGLTELGEKRSNGCVERLAACAANVIVPLGGTALGFLVGDNRIMKWRGSILTAGEKAPKRKVIPTIHPAASLRGNYTWRHFIASDLAKAKKESEYSELRLLERTLLIDPTYEEAISFLEETCDCKAVAFDIEVINHQVSCISFATSPVMCMSIPFVDDGGKDRWSEQAEEDIWLAIEDVLSNPTIDKIGQNLIFDISFLFMQNSITTKGRICDTMVAHHIIYPDFPKGLDFLCSMHTNEPYYKDDGKLWKKPWADLEAFWLYNCRDSATSFEIWEAIESILTDDDYLKSYQDTIDLFPVLIYMMARGVRVDRDALAKTKERVEEQIKKKEDELEKVAEHSFNPASPKQCQEYFYVTKSIKPYISRSTGRPTTDDKAMSRIYRRHHLPEAKLVQEIRSLKKLHGTYLEVGVDKDDRIRCSYNPRGTVTGRLSSSQTIFGTGMNMQNLHPEFKEFIIADRE